MSLAVFPSRLLINADNFNPQDLTGGAACAAWQVNSFVHHVDMVVWDGDVLVDVVAEWLPWEANTCWHGNWQNDFCEESILGDVGSQILLTCWRTSFVEGRSDQQNYKFCTLQLHLFICSSMWFPHPAHAHTQTPQSIDRSCNSFIVMLFLSVSLSFICFFFIRSFLFPPFSLSC